ncbi:hypothetical protein ACIQHY_28270 [Streptomyces sp. NPDC092359]|uniref:hypothetical protein n=1 Tax=Streptomyces sp. NPDC092359 TaxID=3366014 RepID=UPI003822CDB2
MSILAAADQDGRMFDPDEITDQVMTLFTAGFDTALGGHRLPRAPSSTAPIRSSAKTATNPTRSASTRTAGSGATPGPVRMRTSTRTSPPPSPSPGHRAPDSVGRRGGARTGGAVG